MLPAFPFSAVVGQPQLKLALLLNAIDPMIGGVLISGPRGIGKSTLARGLAELIDAERFVNLPLGASEEKLIGSLDLNKALADNQVEFSPGLLARAHQGVLYVDEVNLLPDPLVDQLLDVAASGVNLIERDGLSHQHPARFVLVGTMNPEEGELRPQLLDRFGCCVELSTDLSAEQRVEAVQRRLAFDQAPDAFVNQFSQQQRQLTEQIVQAQQALSNIKLEIEQQLDIAQRCEVAGCEGLRADLAMQRAAKAYAAWQGDAAVSAEHIDAVAEFVLCHRRRAQQAPQSPQQAQSNPSPAAAATPTPQQGDWGSMPPNPVSIGAETTLTPFRDKKKQR